MSCGTVPDYGNDEENGAVVLVGAGLSGLYDAGLRGTPLVLRVCLSVLKAMWDLHQCSLWTLCISLF